MVSIYEFSGGMILAICRLSGQTYRSAPTGLYFTFRRGENLCVRPCALDVSQQLIDTNFTQCFGINLFNDYGTVQAVLSIIRRQVTRDND